MLSFLRRPYPAYVYGERVYLSVVFMSLLVFCILFFLEPFQLDELQPSTKLLFSASYGLATLLISAMCIVVAPMVFPAIFDSRRWTVGKEICFLTLMLLLISLANVQVNIWLQDIFFSPRLFLLMTGYTLLIAIVPVTMTVIFKQQLLLRRYQREANEVNAWVTRPQPALPPQTQANIPPVAEPQPIVLRGDNQGETLSLEPQQWLAAEANDNYCRIFFEHQGRQDSVLYRTTLKKLEDQLITIPGFYRSHKSFLVNLSRVTHLSGNAQGYRLHLQGGQLQVPVSRSLHAHLKKKLAEVKQPVGH